MDRLSINSNYRNFINEMCENHTLGFNLLDTKEIFKIASALGLKNPSELKNKDGYVRFEFLRIEDTAIYSSILLSAAKSSEEIDMYSDPVPNYVQAEKCAESGFAKLKQKVDSANGDEELLIKRLISDLEILYNSNVAPLL